MPDDAIERYLPTLERARAARLSLRAHPWRIGSGVDLLTKEPLEQQRLAAVTLDARVLHRNVWEKDVELSVPLFEVFPTALPPAPEGPTSASHRVLVGVLDHGPGRCTQCSARPGSELCGGCGGSGRIFVDEGRNRRQVPCPRCDGEGFQRCSTCDGSAVTRRARVRYIDDQVSSLRYTYVPFLAPSLERALDEALDARDALPASLRFDPRPGQQGGPYRSAAAGEPMFHGHRFSDALQRAVIAAAGLAGKGQPLHQEMVTYARPILWLRYKLWGAKCEAVLSTRANGELAGFVAA